MSDTFFVHFAAFLFVFVLNCCLGTRAFKFSPKGKKVLDLIENLEIKILLEKQLYFHLNANVSAVCGILMLIF